jgi:hypothetical protein
MRNYTEDLKKYWRTSDLVFIATFKKINTSQGFFNDFINPISKMKLYYPVWEEIEILDKRVSVFHGEASSLSDGYFYQVRLEHTNTPKGKNNPYSLRIGDIKPVDQAEIKRVLEKDKKDGLETTKFYGCYRKASDTFASFENVMYCESGEILMNEGEAQKIFVSPKLPLQENAYYSFFIKKNESKLPNAIQSTIQEVNLNPYKEYIRLRFERLNNPEANKMIANLMREIGKGMYSSKQRMIFELLQNADDSPGKEKVEFHIDINGEYFFIMHDGAPFNKDDVEAITSAAESTKRGDNKKTGYKGIGFKSVFTDSTEVWIKSGGYQFAFQRNSGYFNDFDKFYFSSERYRKYPELLEEDRLKYRGQRLKFNGSTDIPWQVIPIWQNQLPSEFNDSNFNNFNNPVQFALRLGANNIEEYKVAVDNISKRPQFLLFLRNTSKFRSPKNGVTILRSDKNQVIEIVKSKRGEQNQAFYYTKKAFDDIPISDEAFSEFNIGLKKQSRINDYNEITYYFTDLDGREIETIPPKLASANATEISFGISLVENKISPESQYLQGISKYSSLFTYLPMEDTRFQLPFLINADFVPSSDRQKIQGDNLWNKYVMLKVAEKHVITLHHYATEFLKHKGEYNSYLSLLLKEILPDDDTAQQIIDTYNEKYLEKIKVTPIVINDKYKEQLLSETIIDNSGLVELFGAELFYQIIDTEKCLPHPELDIRFLKEYDYLNVQIVNLQELAERITPDLCIHMGEVIGINSLYDKPELLQWLDKLAFYLGEDFGKIPFVVHGRSLYSIEELMNEKDAWILNKNTKDYSAVLEDAGYHIVDLQVEKYRNINTYLNSYNGYINDKLLAYDRLANNTTLPYLDTRFKLKLIDFMQNSEFMHGIGAQKYFEGLKIFVDENKMPRPLRQLLTRSNTVGVSSLSTFKIDESEFNQLSESLKNELIQEEEVFRYFILNKELFSEWTAQFDSQNLEQYVKDLTTIYGWKLEDDEVSQSQWAAIPWIYVDDEIRFIGSEKVFWSNAFNQIKLDHYYTLKNILHQPHLKVLPANECGSLISLFNLKTDNVLISNWTDLDNLDTKSANILLDWMEVDGTYNSFLEEYTLTASGSDEWVITALEDLRVFDGSENALKEYINSVPSLKLKFKELDGLLSGESRHKIGLLQGLSLLNALIDSKSYDQKFATLLPQNLSWGVFNGFISNLTAFELEAQREYGSNTPEHIILNQIVKSVDEINTVPENVQNTIDCLKKKITIDKSPISDYDLSDIIQFGKGDEKKTLKLSSVLEEFKGESDVLDTIIESFSAIREKAKLRKLIFKTRRMTLDEVCSKIEAESSTFYSVYQVVFQILYEEFGGDKEWTKLSFDDYWKNKSNDSELHSAYQSFLDIVLAIDFSNLNNFNFHDLQLYSCVDKNWATYSESLPQWVSQWIEIEPERRMAFISELGFNGPNSSIVRLRQAIIAEHYEPNTVVRYFEEAKANSQVVWNTIMWLSGYSTEKVTRNISLIKQINDYVDLDISELTTVTIPIIDSISKDGVRSYKLQTLSTDSKLYTLAPDEDSAHSIFNILGKRNGLMLFVDNNCGKKASHFTVENITLKTYVDADRLLKESKLWDNAFYRKWELFCEYPIYIYNDNEIPYKQTYLDITISCFTSDLKVAYDGKYFVSKILIRDILNNLPDSFPNEALLSLKEWHYQTLQDESLLDEDSFQYKQAVDRILQDRLGLSRDDQKRESGNAKTHAIYFLSEQDFDISHVNDAGIALTGITDPDGTPINCIVRSAKGGLLYLDKQHWDMLEDNQTYLVVIYPGNSPRLFKSQVELLDEELASNVLFRVPNTKNTSEIDNVFQSLESESHLILVTSEKMKESLFSKLKRKVNINPENDVAIGDDNFTL